MALFDTEHKTVPLGSNHPTHDLEFADLATRDAHTYTNADIGKDYRVLSNNTWYKLIGQSSGVGSFVALASITSSDALPAIAKSFAFGDVATQIILTASAGQTITRVMVVMLASFNGTSPSITIGDSGNQSRLLAATNINLQEVATFETSPNYKYTSSTDVNLYLSAGGASVGNGLVFLFIN